MQQYMLTHLIRLMDEGYMQGSLHVYMCTCEYSLQGPSMEQGIDSCMQEMTDTDTHTTALTQLTLIKVACRKDACKRRDRDTRRRAYHHGADAHLPYKGCRRKGGS